MDFLPLVFEYEQDVDGVVHVFPGVIALLFDLHVQLFGDAVQRRSDALNLCVRDAEV